MVRFWTLSKSEICFCEELSCYYALAGGNRDTDGTFNNLGTNANFWSSSPSSGNALRRNLNSTEARVNRNANDQANGFSVRCLRDLEQLTFGHTF
jgi:uncharacterized protein (TIGR02145 family)